MSGSLYHARRFERRPYVGADGNEHWEIEPIDGAADVVSHTSWHGLIRHCAELGVPEDVWPSFILCECAIDVPLDEVQAKQRPFRRALLGLSPVHSSGHELLARIVAYLERGEAVFFTD
jgi:hypothetical protein